MMNMPDGSDRLRRMAGERSITVLLARMYIDQMIREREGAGGIRPDSVPKLMLSYLNQLNRTIEPRISGMTWRCNATPK